MTEVKNYPKIKLKEIEKYHPYSDWEYRNRDKERSCSFIYGNSTKISSE